ncbi:hypothetical protein CONLIGDRAFT_717667 [Coniochaeta ligniaria NRRL 30616]|uniref:Uncharacterized protein n=1 Tax=Coniochaeta ligniaria NRRL 30616 TaxID=1408157 RepID=A0A1J7IFG2_9PEZI|nr:hypothetical protein CONLIGDRAFT_717667 [Coniochaeta ligniaria NRRL 30616]
MSNAQGKRPRGTASPNDTMQRPRDKRQKDDAPPGIPPEGFGCPYLRHESLMLPRLRANQLIRIFREHIKDVHNRDDICTRCGRDMTRPGNELLHQFLNGQDCNLGQPDPPRHPDQGIESSKVDLSVDESWEELWATLFEGTPEASLPPSPGFQVLLQ